MSSFSRTIAMSALVGASMLAGPLTAMAADSVAPAATQAAPVATPERLRGKPSSNGLPVFTRRWP